MSRVLLFLLLLMGVIAFATYLLYRYFDRREQRRHERELEQQELTERLVEEAESEYERRARDEDGDRTG